MTPTPLPDGCALVLIDIQQGFDDPGWGPRDNPDAEQVAVAGEPVVRKTVNSAFIGTDLDQRLRTLGVPGVVLAGLTTDHCVSTTARMAGNLGYPTWLVADACAAHDRVSPDGTRYPAHVVHDVALASLHDEFATVLQSTDLLDATADAS